MNRPTIDDSALAGIVFALACSAIFCALVALVAWVAWPAWFALGITTLCVVLLALAE